MAVAARLEAVPFAKQFQTDLPPTKDHGGNAGDFGGSIGFM